MKGDLGKMPKFKQLKTTNKMLESNKRGRSGSNQRSPKFFLAPSSKHTFKVKSKDLGELNILYVEVRMLERTLHFLLRGMANWNSRYFSSMERTKKMIGFSKK